MKENTLTNMSYSWKSFFGNLRFGVKIFVIAIVLAIVLRVFLFASFKIPSGSMEPAIMTGDYIIVNKQIPGPRIVKNFFSLSNGEKPLIKRIKGYRTIKRNDVLVFNLPYQDGIQLNLNLYYAKRCVAIPGDTFYIDNGIYKVKNSTDRLGNYENQSAVSQREDSTFQPVIYNCFPIDPAYHWTIKHFGPLYVPKKGDTLLLDTFNIKVYQNPVSYETGKLITIENSHILLGDSIIDNYTFQLNYYFMAGDFVFDSRDSRYWGLLPEDHIVGKASVIWQSKDINTGKRRWERTLKTIK
ncbi:signal peptidase I [Bacteroidia bacterium]|nr:signal peptidase I [Bacteroidia bacterium]